MGFPECMSTAWRWGSAGLLCHLGFCRVLLQSSVLLAGSFVAVWAKATWS